MVSEKRPEDAQSDSDSELTTIETETTKSPESLYKSLGTARKNREWMNRRVFAKSGRTDNAERDKDRDRSQKALARVELLTHVDNRMAMLPYKLLIQRSKGEVDGLGSNVFQDDEIDEPQVLFRNLSPEEERLSIETSEHIMRAAVSPETWFFLSLTVAKERYPQQLCEYLYGRLARSEDRLRVSSRLVSMLRRKKSEGNLGNVTEREGGTMEGSRDTPTDPDLIVRAREMVQGYHAIEQDVTVLAARSYASDVSSVGGWVETPSPGTHVGSDHLDRGLAPVRRQDSGSGLL